MVKIGMLLHPERGVDSVFEEARQADQQGFDSIWLGDHIMGHGYSGPDGPLDSVTIMTSLAA
jgi:alkanesulfonate monooxygenase SsuD/methylene tetrahydromethanopterin reductase-like flavin-dependent oxidoreductase (luciferase family)